MSTLPEGLLPGVRDFLGRCTRLYINGSWVEPRAGKCFRVEDPATALPIAVVAEADALDIDAAVQAARTALTGKWSTLSPARRARILWQLADLIEAHAAELAQLETLDTGKPLREAEKADVPGTVEHFRYFAGWTTKVAGETVPVSGPGQHLVYTRREPVGVVAAIVPWNFPLLITSWKLAPALAMGNTVVLKPSEITPLTALRLAELAEQAGLPPGVLNVVPGFGSVAGAALVQHPGVDKISFTGSPRVGREIMVQAAQDFKRVTLELGGKSPNIVFPDADLDAAVAGAMSGIFFNQGEICAAGSRLYVDRASYDRVVAGVVAGAGKLAGAQGHGLDAKTRIGPLVSAPHAERVLGFVERARSEGAEVLVGGGRNAAAGAGHFVAPTVLAARDDQEIVREEVFGPVLAVLPFDSVADVVRRANDTRYGLAAAVWTSDMKKAFQVAHALRAGTVWLNGYNLFDSAAPWGGFKQSGIGREKGRAVLEAMSELKTVWVNLS